MAESTKEVMFMPKSKRIAVPAYSSEKEGRSLERLVPDSKRMMDIYAGKIQPGGGGASPAEPYQHEGEECCYVLSGKLEFTVEGEKYLVEAGDLIYFPSTFKHYYRNPGPDVAAAFWAEPMIADPPAS